MRFLSTNDVLMTELLLNYRNMKNRKYLDKIEFIRSIAVIVYHSSQTLKSQDICMRSLVRCTWF